MAKKKGAGRRAVRTRGSIEKIGENKYRIRIYLNLDKNGKQQYHREMVYGSEAQANQRLTEICASIDDGTYIIPSKITVKEFFERWLTDYAASKRPKTLENHKNMIKYILPEIGNIQLQKLKPYHIDALYTKLLQSGRRIRVHSKDEKNQNTLPPTLSPTTVNSVHRTLHAALETAVNWELIARNPASRVKAPSPQKRKMSIWTDKQCAQFLAYVAGHRLYALYALVTATGLRRSEAAGLRWSDIDFEAGTINIQQIVVMVEGKPKIQAMPKTEASEDVMPIGQALVKILHKHKMAQQKERWGMKDMYEDHNLVFCQENGKPLWVGNLGTRDFHLLCKKAKVPQIRFHDLRHTYATHLFGLGYSVPDVQKRLRHTRASTTVDMYGHSRPETQQKIADSSDDLLRKPMA